MAKPLCGGVTPTSNQVNTCAKFEEISQDNVKASRWTDDNIVQIKRGCHR